MITTPDQARAALKPVADAALKAQRGVDPYADVAQLRKCEGCGCLVRLLTTKKGKRVPVNAWPYWGRWGLPLVGHEHEAYGALYVLPLNALRAARSGWAGRALMDRSPPSTVWGWRPHHADCPKAGVYRKKRASQQRAVQ